MSKKKKIVICIISFILVVLIGGLGFVGNYFFEYALLRQEGIVTAANVDPNAPQSNKNRLPYRPHGEKEKALWKK